MTLESDEAASLRTREILNRHITRFEDDEGLDSNSTLQQLAMDDLDTKVRLKAFSFIEDLSCTYRDALPRELLAAGFDFEQTRIPLIGPQGIFKPAILQVPISITTVPIIEGKARPYEDEIGNDGLMRYKYRGSGPMHRDNVGLRLAMQMHLH
jgi:putative restriction endonuclease